MEFLSPGNLVKRYEPVHEILVLTASANSEGTDKPVHCVFFQFIT